MAQADIERELPNLFRAGYAKRSNEDDNYNCVAWAIEYGTDTDWWSPAPIRGYYWPSNVPRGLTIEAFAKLFEVRCGYEPCDNGEFEEGYQKLALYEDSHGRFCHVARQKDQETWTKKLGVYEHVDHRDPFILEADYGPIKQFLKRPVQNAAANQS